MSGRHRRGGDIPNRGHPSNPDTPIRGHSQPGTPIDSPGPQSGVNYWGQLLDTHHLGRRRNL